MAGHARYTALLDACVLFPMVMADALMSLASAGLFTAKWTTAIEDEWVRALEAHRPDLKGRLGYRREQMRLAIPDWEVPESAWRPLSASLIGAAGLPDVDDAHVIAAAIAGHADCIVTINARDFPASALQPYGIEVVHPDAFILNQWDLDEAETLAALRGMRERWKKPYASALDFADAFRRGGLVTTAQRLAQASDRV
jgi:predicted nucleic acid-binding protein